MKTIKNFIISLILRKEEKEILKKHKDGFLGIYWHVNDFETRATTLEEYEDVETGSLYDRSQFTLVLERMISEHDASLGVNWETVDVYLDEYCKF